MPESNTRIAFTRTFTRNIHAKHSRETFTRTQGDVMLQCWKTITFAIMFAVVGIDSAHAADPLKLSFGGQEYVHRWSKDGQHEFTPPSEPDLKVWRHMVTVNVHDKVRNGEQLAQLANGVVGNYQRAGKILRTDSKPRTKDSEAEHLVVAFLAGRGVMEAAFARVRLVDGVGTVTVYSQREYGDKATAVIGEWVQNNGAAIEKTLMSWNGMPAIPRLNALPPSK